MIKLAKNIRKKSFPLQNVMSVLENYLLIFHSTNVRILFSLGTPRGFFSKKK